MPEDNFTLEEQYSLPLVQDMVNENARLTALLGTKIPDSQIEKLTVPHVFKNKLLMKEGTYNGVYYSTDVILEAVDDAEGKGLVYDHLDSTNNEGASNWTGHVINPHWDENGADGAGMYGDLKVVDKACAQLLASGAKWGISPAIDYKKNEVGDQVIGTDLLWKSFSFVLSPAVRETMLNNLKKIKGDGTMDKNISDLDAHGIGKGKLPYKYPAQNQETPEEKKIRMKLKKGDKGELQVDEKTLQILEARDAEIAELKEFKDKIELSEKSVCVAALVANEYLIGRLSVNEMADREKALMEKSTDVLTELAEVIGSHAKLTAYTTFTKSYGEKHKEATLKEAALAWKKKEAKLETPTVDPAMPGAAPGAKPPVADPNGETPEGATEEPVDGVEGANDLEEGEGYINDPVKPVVNPNAAASAALTGPGGVAPGRALAELRQQGHVVSEADVAMHGWITQHGGR